MNYEQMIQDCITILVDAGVQLQRLRAAVSDGAPEGRIPALISRFQRINEQAVGFTRGELHRRYPEIVWAELPEGGVDAGVTAPLPEGAYWICDPIDGAVNFLQGLPEWCVTLCLVRQGEPVLTVIHAPDLGETYTAYIGGGARRNGAPVAASAVGAVGEALVAAGHPTHLQADLAVLALFQETFSRMLQRALGARIMGCVSLQLAKVASGELDGYWEFGDDHLDWIGGALLVAEAGGRVTDRDGAGLTSASRSIVAAGARLQPALRAVL